MFVIWQTMSSASNTAFKTLNIYEYTEYRDFLKDWIEKIPKKKRGQLARIAEAGNVHKTTLSQIFSGSKDLSLEQAFGISRYLGLSQEESDFFVLLVNYARAASRELKESFRRQIENYQKAWRQLSHRVTKSRELNDEEKATFYSNWIYSAVRNASAIESCKKPLEIARKLGVDLATVNQTLEFLLKHQLCVMTDQGVAPGPKMTHLEATSPFVTRHHANWRIKALGNHPMLRHEQELAYTAPMTLSTQDAARVRSLLAELVEKTDEIVGPSPSEKLYCMCLDWFEIR